MRLAYRGSACATWIDHDIGIAQLARPHPARPASVAASAPSPWHVALDPEPDLLLDAVQIEPAVPDREVLVVEAEVAAEHAPALGLDADEPVVVARVFLPVRRGQRVEIHEDRRFAGVDDLPAVPAPDSRDARERLPCRVGPHDGGKRPFTFALDHGADGRVAFEHRLAHRADLRAAQDDRQRRPLATQNRAGREQRLDVPHVARQSHEVRFARQDLRRDVFRGHFRRELADRDVAGRHPLAFDQVSLQVQERQRREKRLDVPRREADLDHRGQLWGCTGRPHHSKAVALWRRMASTITAQPTRSPQPLATSWCGPSGPRR